MRLRVVTSFLIAACLPRLARAQAAPPETTPAQPALPAAHAPTPTPPAAATPAASAPPAAPTPAPRLPVVPPPPTLMTPPATPAPVIFTQTERFGSQIVGADLAAVLGSLALAGLSGSPLALFVYFLAAPAVHASHEDAVGAAESFLVHLTLPFAGALIGSELEQRHCGHDLCGLGGAVLGGSLGLASATAVDAIFLAHKTTTVTMARAPRVRAAPALALTPEGTLLLGLRARL